MKKGLFSMNNAQMKYALVVAGMMFLLALLSWFNVNDYYFYHSNPDTGYAMNTVCICVVIPLILIGALFLLKKDNALILHIAFACTSASAYNIFFTSYYAINYYMIIITCLLFLFYIGGFFALKRKRQTPDNDRFYLFGIALFTVIGILIDLFSWLPEQVSLYSSELKRNLYTTVMTLKMMPSMFGAFLILIPLIYLPFYLTKNIKPAVSYTAMGIAVLLTLINVGINLFSYDMDLAQFFENLILVIGIFTAVIGIFTAYIVYDRIIHSKKSKTADNPTASAKQAALSFDEKVEKLQKLQMLREAGILTEEEFSAQKQKIVGGK